MTKQYDKKQYVKPITGWKVGGMPRFRNGILPPDCFTGLCPANCSECRVFEYTPGKGKGKRIR